MDLPYNAEAEKQVLANMIFSSDLLIETLTRLNENDFYVPQHKIIFSTLKNIYDKNKAKIEPYALIDALSIDGNLEKVGDASYILELVDSYNDLANSKYYINSVEEKSILRSVILAANKIVTKWSEESSGDISNYINKVEKEITDITKKRRVEDFVSINDAFKIYKEKVSLIKSGQDNVNGLLTGYTSFDKLTLGFKPGEINILAARPSVGKSALALNFLFRTAMKTKKPCAFFSLEMGIESITNRILSAKSGVPIRKIQTASFDKEEEININKAMRDISECNLFIDETSAIKTVDIRAKLNKLQSRYGELGLIVIDYIGLITPDVKAKDSVRSLELGAISASLKAIARDFKCPLLVLSQLSRSIDSRTSKEPQLSDLRESGSIEQDADVVMFIHRPDYGKMQEAANGENGSDDPNATSDSPVSLIIAKNRNGRIATIDFMFQKHIGRFVEMDRDH
ncbi:MAG: replicative DNA helicase [Erysipelotrichaceae bacterium]|nr:replicative DNA helicase [Erysipelotrichaceae bacterium]